MITVRSDLALLEYFLDRLYDGFAWVFNLHYS